MIHTPNHTHLAVCHWSLTVPYHTHLSVPLVAHIQQHKVRRRHVVSCEQPADVPADEDIMIVCTKAVVEGVEGAGVDRVLVQGGVIDDLLPGGGACRGSCRGGGGRCVELLPVDRVLSRVGS